MTTRAHNYLREKISWGRSADLDYPYEAEIDGEKLVIRLNDFPAERLYTLFVNDEEIASFDDWPKQWIKPPV
jgi:hypothetical protein